MSDPKIMARPKLRLVDPAERLPPSFVRIKCKVCGECWFDKEDGRCVYHGPFAGYCDNRWRPVE